MPSTSPTASGDGALAPEGSELALDPVRAARLKREIGRLRDRASAADERALTGVFLAAELASGGPLAASPPKADPSQRMFEYGVLHERAAPWDGCSTRSGTITYVAVDRVEQYVGQQVWVAYAPGELGAFSPELGDQLRIARRGGAVAVERIATNRLQSSAPSREARSGMTLFFASPLAPDEIESTAQSVAQRYAAGVTLDAHGISLDFNGAAKLELSPRDPFSLGATMDAARLLALPVAAAVRLEVTARSNSPQDAHAAEGALTLSAALLTSEGQAVGIDDSGAVFAAEDLYALGTRNETRADAFAFAAAVAGRVWPAPASAQRENVYDELAVFSTLPWRADFAISFLQRSLEDLADGAERSGDPIVPPDGAFCDEAERGQAGTRQPLVRLLYQTAAIEVSFLDASAPSDEAARLVAVRTDVAALLGRPAQSALIFTLSSRGQETESEQFALEMRRADAFVTALAAICARLGDCIASDAAGSLYDVEDLLVLALHRRGKTASWKARVAAALNGAAG